MNSQLLINRRGAERRVALIENGVTTELFFERVGRESLIGNIYKGRVVRVLPGIQSAFVDIGLARAGFLFVGDLAQPLEESVPPGVSGPVGDRYPGIDELLRGGEEILVQIVKEPFGTKGARVSPQITLPGRHLVYVPGDESVGVSRRIADHDERARLREMAEALKPQVGGLIVRTAGEGAGRDELVDDRDFLLDLWQDIRKRADAVKAPELVHSDLDVTLRAIRDLKLDRVLVDDAGEAERVRSFVERFVPDYEGEIEVWQGADPLFERFGLEHEISRAVRRKVWLRSGGYIIIDRTEALTAVDVNTGRYVGGSNFDETVLEINLEAVKEIAYQLRFRDIGGLIVIDFIDMAFQEHRDRVTATLREAMADDKARSKILPMSELGLVEMTRKRVRDSIVQSLTEPCFYCDGRGYLRSVRVIVYSILSTLAQRLVGGATGILHVVAHPRIIAALIEDHGDELSELERRHNAEIQVVEREDLHLEAFEIS